MPPFDASIADARADVVRFGKQLVADGLVVGSHGNISIRLGDAIVMSPSGMNYDVITAENVNVLSESGEILDGSGRRSSEWLMHRRIYDLTSAGAVVHTHSPISVALGTVFHEIPAIHYTILGLGGPTVRVAPYATFGSQELAENAATALDGRVAALLQNHGTIAYGSTIQQAYDRARLLEWLAEIYWRAMLVGHPRILSDDELAAVTESARQRRYSAAGRGEA